MREENSQIPLFPLNTVLYPGEAIPLRIFEPRYVDMIKRCMKEDIPFGVCLIKSGSETGEAAEPCRTGTSARIVDFSQGSDGLLYVVVRGERRFLVLSTEVQTDQLLLGNIRYYQEETGCPVTPEQAGQVNDLLAPYQDMLGKAGFIPSENLVELTYQLGTVLPLSPELKQQLLETDAGEDRLQLLSRWFAS